MKCFKYIKIVINYYRHNITRQNNNYINLITQHMQLIMQLKNYSQKP